MENTGFKGWYITVGLIVIVVLCILFGSWFTVQPGTVSMIKRMGVLQEKLYQPGFYFQRPFIDNEVNFNVQNTKEQTTAAAASRDLQNIATEVAINYNIDATKVRDIYTQIGDFDSVGSKIIAPSIQETVKAVTSKYTAEELITKRGSVSSDMTTMLKEKLSIYGVNVIDVNIINFQFSQGFDQAIEAKVRAEQDALAQKNKLEQVKYEAQQQIETAKAEAESIRIQAQAVQNQGGAEYVQLQWIAKWNGALPQYQLGQNTQLLMSMPGK